MEKLINQQPKENMSKRKQTNMEEKHTYNMIISHNKDQRNNVKHPQNFDGKCLSMSQFIPSSSSLNKDKMLVFSDVQWLTQFRTNHLRTSEMW